MDNAEFQNLLESVVTEVFDNSEQFIERFLGLSFIGDIDEFHMAGFNCRAKISDCGRNSKDHYFDTADVLDWFDEL